MNKMIECMICKKWPDIINVNGLKFCINCIPYVKKCVEYCLWERKKIIEAMNYNE